MNLNKNIFHSPPLKTLLENGLVSIGEELTFSYRYKQNVHVFKGVVHSKGININGEDYPISLGALKCLRSIGVYHNINGFWAWRTKERKLLGELFLPLLNPNIQFESKFNFRNRNFYYQFQRDVVFIFGAGASYADGAPLKKDLLGFLLNDEDLKNTFILKTVKEFIDDNFYWDSSKDIYPALEHIFGFLDYFILKKESLSKKYNLRNLNIIKESLIYAIYFVVSRYTKKESEVYSKFWNNVFLKNTNISLITLNYDTYLEDAFQFLFPCNLFLDYCIDLENYDITEIDAGTKYWINPRSPIISPRVAAPRSIKLIKIHGSLNWKYCNCCNGVLLTPFDNEMVFYDGEPPWNYSSMSTNTTYSLGNSCIRDGNEYDTILVPPSHLKDLTHPICQSLFIEAGNELRKAKKLVFIGYSLPESDVHIKGLLKKSLNKDTEIIVVDINNDENFKMKFKELSENVEFFTGSFGDFLKDENYLNKIFNSE